MGENEKSFKYYAFISYSHKDEKWAKWIHRALEHYRLPAIMHKAEKNRYPKRIAPVFLDSADLGVGDLGKTLPNELAKSRYLIVLCSPNSANPNEQGKNYIDQEVTWFCDEGRDDNIIPIIIEGTPNDAFCQSLKEREILAVDATKHSKARIVNDIVAKLLGLAPDELWKRELRRVRQRRIIHSAVAIAVASVVGCLAWLFTDHYCEHIEYYSDYINDWGVPRGIKPLSGKALSHRSGYYKFTYKGYASQSGQNQRVLRTVSYCNAAGLVSDAAQHVWFKRPPLQDFYYENGTLIRKVARNEDGIEMYSLNVSDEGIWSKSSNDPNDANWIWGGTIAGYKDLLKGLGFDMNISHLLPEFRALASVPSFYVSEKTEAGLPSRIDFLPNNRARFSMSNGLGAYGEKYSYDEIGRLTGVRFLEKDGKPFAETNVFAGLDVSYSNLTTTVVSIDACGKPIANTFGWIIKQFVYSPSGNLEKIRYLDENMKLVPDPFGVAVLQMEYDEENRHELRSFRYDSQNKLISDNVGWAISETKWQGKVQHIYYKKATGEEYVTEDGYSHISVERTPSRRIERYYLGNDIPVRHAKSLAHKRVLTIEQTGVDGEDLIVHGSFYDEQQQPVISRDLSFGNISNVTFRMSRMGIEEMTFLPAASAKCATIKIDRTARFGKIVKSRLSILDENGDPMIPKPIDSFTHDELSKAKQSDVMAASVNLSKLPSDDSDGVEVSLDEMGRIERVSKLRNGRLSDNAFWCAQSKIAYGENGLISRIVLEDKDGIVSSNVFGIAAIDFRYDRKGLTDEIFLGVDMKPVGAKFVDVARMSFEYDRYGHVTWTRLYNEKNELTVSSQLGGAVIHQEYSPLGEPLLFECFDEKMQRIPKVGTLVYVAKYSYQKLDDCRVVVERFFGKDGSTPVVSPEPGYHMMRNVFNLRGQPLDQSTYDIDCKTLRSDKNGGLARMVMQYDPNGQPERLRWYDCNNKLVMEQVDVDRNGCVDVPIRVLGDTYGRWGLQDFDVVVSVNDVFCLGDVELTETCMSQPNVAKKITVVRFGQMFGQPFWGLQEGVIPVEDDGSPVRFDVTYVPLKAFVKIREAACPKQQKMNAALAVPLSM